MRSFTTVSLNRARSGAGLIAVTGVLVAAAFAVSLLVGRYPLGFGDIVAIITGGRGGFGTDADGSVGGVSSVARSVFFHLRLPRTIMALLAGAGLGMAGSVFQIVFRNPLAAPDIIGVSSGANLGAAVAIVAFGYGAGLIAASAFAGGMLVLALVIIVARMSRNNSTVTFILAGIIMKAVSDAVIMMLKYYADPGSELASIEYWAMGSLSSMTGSKLVAMLPFFLVGFIGLIAMRRQILMLILEDDEARTLGVNLKIIRTAVLGFAALIVASIVSQTGLIAFAGLIAPHAARLALRRVSFLWCILSGLTGALILLISDMFVRSIGSTEIPVSVPTTLIGVPILLFFMWSRKRGRV